MKKLVLMTFCMIYCAVSFAQTEEEMKAWQDNMKPSENHKWLATLDGEWDATVTMWMDPSQPPTVSKASTTNKMIMGGLYQRSSHSGEMMGMPFEGESVTGFDNAQKKFLSTWIDNFGSGIMYLEGQYNPKSDVLTLEGNMIDPITSENILVKHVLTKISEDSHNFLMYIVQDDKDSKIMEIDYNRRK